MVSMKSVLLCVLFASGGAVAAAGPAINTDPSKLAGRTISFFKLDRADVALLEPACVIPLTNGGYGAQWFDMIRGHRLLEDPRYAILKGADSMHHYCRAQAAKIRYFRETNPAMKRRLLENMLWEYTYMIEHPEFVPKNWPYMKVMHFELGNARVLQRKPAEAIHSFEAALKLDPAYEKAHVAYADLLAEMGNRTQALAQVTEGIKHNPNSKSLKRRYLELGGKLPYPKPYTSNGEENDTSQAGRSTDNEAMRQPQIENGKTPVSVDSESALAAEQPKTVAPVPSSSESQPRNGSNPYCRFCP